MKVVIPTFNKRVSSVFDAARSFELICINQQKQMSRSQVIIENSDPIYKAKRIIGLGANFLICGAISRSIEIMFISAGVTLIPNTCGGVEEVIVAFLGGNFTQQEFLMPGCTGQRRRHRSCQRNNKKMV
ncbi:MAG: hypothetical protein JXR91_08940 [Deltaproteobacteria bacterium]|nr:hypothetical protein [Deltaproteobacteria bacterium]